MTPARVCGLAFGCGLALVLGVARAAAPAAPAPAPEARPPAYIGHWKADGDAAPDMPAILSLEGATLALRPKPKARPVCKGAFALQPEKPGTVYRNAEGRKFVAGSLGSLPTFLLNIEPGTCPVTASQWRISFPLPYDRRHMELIEYQGGRATGSRRYVRAD